MAEYTLHPFKSLAGERPVILVGQGVKCGGAADESSPIHPQRTACEIGHALPEDAILVSDIGIRGD